MHINSPEHAVPQILNLSVKNVKGTVFQRALSEKGVCVSVKSACSADGLPSRAEITDAAVALRSECVMLNKGPHITDAIKILDKMAKKLGKSQRKNRIMLRHIHSWDRD